MILNIKSILKRFFIGCLLIFSLLTLGLILALWLEALKAGEMYEAMDSLKVNNLLKERLKKRLVSINDPRGSVDIDASFDACLVGHSVNSSGGKHWEYQYQPKSKDLSIFEVSLMLYPDNYDVEVHEWKAGTKLRDCAENTNLPPNSQQTRSVKSSVK